MFFPRLRRRAKWVFLVLAIAFALAFVVAGVGSGFGSGIGDYIADIFNRTAATDVGSARERARENPRDPEAQMELANALQNEGRTGEAITALERYLKLQPKDADALQQLAGLYLIKAGEAEQRLDVISFESQTAGFGDEILNPSGQLAQGLEAPPITAALRGSANVRYQEAYSAAQAAYREEADAWRRLTALAPEEASYFFELGRASQLAGDVPQAILAYNRYLELSPDASNAAQIRSLVKQLEAQSQAGIGAGGSLPIGG